jgi:hypothetical protein
VISRKRGIKSSDLVVSESRAHPRIYESVTELCEWPLSFPNPLPRPSVLEGEFNLY